MKFQKLSILALSIALLAACGSSGGGSGTSNPNPTPIPTPTPTPANPTKVSGSFSVQPNQPSLYVYTAPGASSGVFLSQTHYGIGITTDSKAGGAIMYTGGVYAQFGTFANTTSPSVAATKVDSFVTAGSPTPVAGVPVSGSATYTGRALRAPYGNTSMTFNVDFSNKTLTGTTAANTAFGSSLNLNGVISGATFSGSASTGTATGNFAGGFYGPAAQELAGTANFANPALDVAFGGKK